MITQKKWIDRIFELGLEPGLFPAILERLKGTPARLEEKLMKLSENKLFESINGGWTINEQVGHLADVEKIWSIRFEDIISGKPEMTFADIKNKQVEENNYNEQNIADLTAQLRIRRERLLYKLEKIDPEQLELKSLHPRLKIKFSPVDLAFFIAEHDDHHLAKINEIIKHK